MLRVAVPGAVCDNFLCFNRLLMRGGGGVRGTHVCRTYGCALGWMWTRSGWATMLCLSRADDGCQIALAPDSQSQEAKMS